MKHFAALLLLVVCCTAFDLNEGSLKVHIVAKGDSPRDLNSNAGLVWITGKIDQTPVNGFIPFGTFFNRNLHDALCKTAGWEEGGDDFAMHRDLPSNVKHSDSVLESMNIILRAQCPVNGTINDCELGLTGVSDNRDRAIYISCNAPAPGGTEVPNFAIQRMGYVNGRESRIRGGAGNVMVEYWKKSPHGNGYLSWGLVCYGDVDDSVAMETATQICRMQRYNGAKSVERAGSSTVRGVVQGGRTYKTVVDGLKCTEGGMTTWMDTDNMAPFRAKKWECSYYGNRSSTTDCTTGDELVVTCDTEHKLSALAGVSIELQGQEVVNEAPGTKAGSVVVRVTDEKFSRFGYFSNIHTDETLICADQGITPAVADLLCGELGYAGYSTNSTLYWKPSSGLSFENIGFYGRYVESRGRLRCPGNAEKLTDCNLEMESPCDVDETLVLSCTNHGRWEVRSVDIISNPGGGSAELQRGDRYLGRSGSVAVRLRNSATGESRRALVRGTELQHNKAALRYLCKKGGDYNPKTLIGGLYGDKAPEQRLSYGYIAGEFTDWIWDFDCTDGDCAPVMVPGLDKGPLRESLWVLC